MDFITEWITNIILFVLIATIIDLLLPSSSMQKYTKMVAGLLLITIILSPIIKLITTDIESTLETIMSVEITGENDIDKKIDLQKKEIQAYHHAYILEEMKNQLKEDVQEELMEKYQLEIANIEFIVNKHSNDEFPLNLQAINVELTEPKGDLEAIEVVKKVEIDTRAPLPTYQVKQNNQQLASLLSEKWDIEKELIYVTVEGGAFNE